MTAEKPHERPDALSRRGFLGGPAALFAASSLPAIAKPEPGRAESRRGRLSPIYVHVKAGAEKPFSALHISDTHLTAAYPSDDEKYRRFMERRTKTFGGMQEEALAVSIDYAKRNNDWLVHTGDLIDFPGKANFDLVRKYFGTSGGLVGAIGNHDYFHGKDLQRRADTFKEAQSAFPFALEFSSTVVNGVNFVALDNSIGPVSDRQLELFEAEAKKGLPIILCAHCPVFSLPNLWAASAKHGRMFPSPEKWTGVQNVTQRTKDFRKRLENEPLLKAVLCGHVHFTVQDRISPTAVQYVVGGNFMFAGQEVMIT